MSSVGADYKRPSTSRSSTTSKNLSDLFSIIYFVCVFFFVDFSFIFKQYRSILYATKFLSIDSNQFNVTRDNVSPFIVAHRMVSLFQLN